jgi:Tol biopolymer transport system component
MLRWAIGIFAVAGGAWIFARYGQAKALLPPLTVRPIVTLPGMESAPSFSPDGTRITFAWRQPPQAGSRIVVKMVDDEPVQELTRPSGGSRHESPAWSPDGRSIAFARNTRNPLSRDGADERSGIYVIPAIGGSERRVYSGQVCAWGGPTWAPDGRTLVFTAIRTSTERCSLFRLSLDTMEIAQLTSSETPELARANLIVAYPAFSPDGKNIAFVCFFQDYSDDVYLIPSQGGAPTRLTFDAKAIHPPVAWTPDATAILFESSRGGSPGLWRVAASGGQPERLSVGANATGGLALDREGRRSAYVVKNGRVHISAFDLSSPGKPPVSIAGSARSELGGTFSSDGKRIVFASNRAGDAWDLWVADTDGTNQRRLTWSTHGEATLPNGPPTTNGWRTIRGSMVRKTSS